MSSRLSAASPLTSGRGARLLAARGRALLAAGKRLSAVGYATCRRH